MSIDIDQFIREQKSKISAERDYLRRASPVTVPDDLKDNNNKPSRDNQNFMFKMKEGESMKNKYKQELRNEFMQSNELNKHIEPLSARKESSPRSDDEGLLPGFRYSNSAAAKRKELERNKEYNEFIRKDQEKFQNRFADKKNVAPPPKTAFQTTGTNPIVADIPHKSTTQPPVQPILIMERNNTSFETKLDELERKVNELRNFRIQNPFLTYSNDMNNDGLVDFGRRKGSEKQPIQRRVNNDYLQYGETNLGRSHLRYLDDAEQKLREIEEKYDASKVKLMRNPKTTARKPILDVDLDGNIDDFFPSGNLQRNNSNKNRNIMESSKASIIPLGNENEEKVKRMRQEQYRKELESQMKEKSDQKKGTTKFNDKSDDGFFFFNDNNNNKQQKQDLRPVGGRFNQMPSPTEMDSDYFFYADRNPLDNFNNSSFIGGSNVVSTAPQNSFTTALNGVLQDFNNFTKFPLESSIKTDRMNNNNYTDRNNTSRKEDYGNELKRQMEERRVLKERQKKEVEEYERKKNEEIANYNPFGRGGGGAPLKDSSGVAIADLRKLLNPDGTQQVNVSLQQKPMIATYRDPQQPTPRIHQQSPTGGVNAQLENTFARGGHGIFGQALTQEDKDKAERYKEELKVQIEMKRKQKDMEKEQERIREEKERVRIEREQQQILLELENEKRVKQEKELEKQRQFEETKRALLKDKEEKQKQREKELEKAAAREREVKPPSPAKQQYSMNEPLREPVREPNKENEPDRTKTRLEIDAYNRAAYSGREDGRIMAQIVNLKNQLQNERMRIEQALLRQRNEVDVSDPRLDALDAMVVNKRASDNNKNVFQAVLEKRGPMSVRRNVPSKERRPKDATSTAEIDLDKYLREQEKLLERMNRPDFSRFELSMPKMDPIDVGLRPSSQMSNQLDADTDFIGFYQSSDFNLKGTSLSTFSPEDFLNSHINTSNFAPPPPQMDKKDPLFGSNTSLNIDELTRKNKQRLRKLQQMQTDNDNSSNYSSDDILNKVLTSANQNNVDQFK